MAALSKVLRSLPLLLTLLAAPSEPLAHRLDEYLQATLVVLELGRVRLQINLGPGVDVAEQVLLHVDRDNNHAISKNEATAYVVALQRDLALRIDGRAAALNLTRSAFPTPAELRSGSGIIQLEFTATFSTLSAGAHRFVLENRHLSSVSVYLFNAVQPASNAITITRQQRDPNQSAGAIDFTVRTAAPMQ